jgi:hypothetical protein
MQSNIKQVRATENVFDGRLLGYPINYNSYQYLIIVIELHFVPLFSTDDVRWMPSDGKTSHCFWQGELIKIEILRSRRKSLASL